MFDAFDNGDFSNAKNLQLKAIEIIRIIASYGFISACKFIMKEKGINNGFVRLPSKQISESEKSEMMSKLRKLDFESIVSS